MATITGMTAAAMEAIRAGAIIDADFDTAGHLILIKYDETQIDAGVVPGATTVLSGAVELATSAETATGTDAVRAVTPAGLSSVRVLTSNSLAETALPSTYPTGTSVMVLTTGSAWTPNSGLGTVVSHITSDRSEQTFYSSAGGTQFARYWTRTYHVSNGGGGWTAWVEAMLLVNLTAASFTQTTTIANYPSGLSRIYYNNTNGTGWDFSGTWGEVRTYKGSDDFTRQTFTEHIGGSANKTREWIRTCTTSGSWSAWQSVVLADNNTEAWTSYVPVWTTTGTAPALGTGGTLTGRYKKNGRTITGVVNLIAGTGTTFGTGTPSFTLPPYAAAASSIAHVGHAHLLDTSRWGGQVIVSSGATTMTPFFVTSSTNNAMQAMDTSVSRPQALTTALQLRMSFTYESAS